MVSKVVAEPSHSSETAIAVRRETAGAVRRWILVEADEINAAGKTTKQTKQFFRMTRCGIICKADIFE